MIPPAVKTEFLCCALSFVTCAQGTCHWHRENSPETWAAMAETLPRARKLSVLPPTGLFTSCSLSGELHASEQRGTPGVGSYKERNRSENQAPEARRLRTVSLRGRECRRAFISESNSLPGTRGHTRNAEEGDEFS